MGRLLAAAEHALIAGDIRSSDGLLDEAALALQVVRELQRRAEDDVVETPLESAAAARGVIDTPVSMVPTGGPNPFVDVSLAAPRAPEGLLPAGDVEPDSGRRSVG